MTLSLEELTSNVKAHLSGNASTKAGSSLPHGAVALIAGYAVERFDDLIFGPEHWKTYYGAVPVTLPSIEILRDRALQVVRATGKETPRPIKEMSVAECANFIGELGQEERPKPPDSLFTCLNTPVHPQDKLVAGFTCAVTYIPQFVRQNGRVLAVTSRTLALELGQNLKRESAPKLAEPEFVLNRRLTEEDANATEASCYFVMELEPSPNTKGKKPSELIAEMIQQGKREWQQPEARNFIATVFSRCAWKGQFLYGREPWAFAYVKGKSLNDFFLAIGGFAASGLFIYDTPGKGHAHYGAAFAQKFQPLSNY